MLPEQHPSTGSRIVVVIPSGPSFTDVRATYERLALSRPWLAVRSEEAFYELKTSVDWASPELFVLSWEPVVAGDKERRGAKVAVLYSEAIGEPQKMIPWHRTWLARLEALAPGYDCILGQTPWMAERLANLGVPTTVFPFGLDPAIGTPDFECEKLRQVVYHGALAGNRMWAIPALVSALGSSFSDVSGSFGSDLNGELNRRLASLYVPHSDVQSFSNFRMWQASASSAAFLCEPSDAWPFVAGDHYVEIPKLSVETIGDVAEAVRVALGQPEMLLETARRAHAFAATRFSSESIVDGHLVDLARDLRDGIPLVQPWLIELSAAALTENV